MDNEINECRELPVNYACWCDRPPIPGTLYRFTEMNYLFNLSSNKKIKI